MRTGIGYSSWCMIASEMAYDSGGCGGAAGAFGRLLDFLFWTCSSLSRLEANVAFPSSILQEVGAPSAFEICGKCNVDASFVSQSSPGTATTTV